MPELRPCLRAVFPALLLCVPSLYAAGSTTNVSSLGGVTNQPRRLDHHYADSSGASDGTVSYSYTANSASVNSCSGTMTIAGARLPARAMRSQSRRRLQTHPWSVTSTPSWISVASGSPGTGSGTVSLNASANTSVTLSIGHCRHRRTNTRHHTIGSYRKPDTWVVQCQCGIDRRREHPYLLHIECNDYAWTASSNESRVAVTTSSGTRSGSINYTVTANNSVTPRNATLTIGDKVFTVSQDAIVGSLTLSSSSALVPATATTGSITFTSNAPDYSWTASSDRSWVTVSPTSGTGGGSIAYSVAATDTVSAQTATLTIGDKTFTITQAGGIGSLTLASPAANVAAGQSSGSVAFTSNYSAITGEGGRV